MFQRAQINDKGQGRAYKMHNHVEKTLDKNVVYTKWIRRSLEEMDFLTPNLPV